MKLSIFMAVTIVGGLLVSCCCPNQGRWHCWTKRSSQPAQAESVDVMEDSTETGLSLVVLRGDNPLPVTPRDQEGLYSCWAACAEMIMEFIGGVRVSQCEQAGRPSLDPSIAFACCDKNWNLSIHPDCDSAHYPEFGRWGYDCTMNFPNVPPPNVLSWQQVRDEITFWRPFAFSWSRAASAANPNIRTSHMLVVIGYNEGRGQQVLFCLNPRAFGATDVILVPYADYSRTPTAVSAAGSDGYLHEHDWFEISLQNNQ